MAKWYAVIDTSFWDVWVIEITNSTKNEVLKYQSVRDVFSKETSALKAATSILKNRTALIAEQLKALECRRKK